MRRFRCFCFIFLSAVMAFSGAAQARQGALPYSLTQRAKVGTNVPVVTVGGVDAVA